MLICLRLTMFLYSGCRKRRPENVELCLANFKLSNTCNITTIPSSVSHVREVSTPQTVLRSTGGSRVHLKAKVKISRILHERYRNKTGLNINVHAIGTESCYHESATEDYEYLSASFNTQKFHSVTCEHKFSSSCGLDKRPEISIN
jgi:hypothetical protein